MFESDLGAVHPDLKEVLEQAALLQTLVPDAVLVGGSAAALYAGHRASYDHDHVVADLGDRFEAILGALERESEWVTNRVVPGKIILGQLGDIEAGVRQLIRRRPLEVAQVQLWSGEQLIVPTKDETLRIKAFLIVKRNQVRDYLDVAALAAKYGIQYSSEVLANIDDFYTDPKLSGKPLKSQLIRQLSFPMPKDTRTMTSLNRYKGLAALWQNWSTTQAVLADIADEMQKV